MQKKMITLLLLTVACAGRTTRELQPVSPAYDASKNDPKALEVIDKMVAALGGADKWDAVKQIRWTVEVNVKGDVMGIYNHSWDRWNGRHRLETMSMSSYKKAEAAGDSGLIENTVVMYRLFDRDRGSAYYDKESNPLGTDDRKKATAEAYKRWQADSYMLTLPYRLTEPGVYVKHAGNNTDDDTCADGCDVIAVTFDPMVSDNAVKLHVSEKTHMVQLVELEIAGKGGPIAYAVQDWTDVNGLKFPGKLDNVGMRNVGDSEVWSFTNVNIGAPDDMLYIPRVR